MKRIEFENDPEKKQKKQSKEKKEKKEAPPAKPEEVFPDNALIVITFVEGTTVAQIKEFFGEEEKARWYIFKIMNRIETGETNFVLLSKENGIFFYLIHSG